MKYITNTVRAYPNKSQEELMDLNFKMCRLMYNTLLKYVFSLYLLFKDEQKNSLNFDPKIFSKSHKIPNISYLKKADDDYKKVDSLAICNEYKNMKRGMQLFYEGLSNKPKFKRNRKDKLTYTTYQVNNNIRFENNKLRLPKIGFVKVKGIRKEFLCYKIKCATVFKDKLGKIYISIIYELPDNINFKDENNDKSDIVGLDFKIGEIFVSSDNFIPKYSEKYFFLINNIPYIQKTINKNKKRSHNYFKNINKLRRIHRKIVDIRKDLQHKISNLITLKYNYIVIENISMKDIAKKLSNGKNTYNTSFNNFVKRLKYKSKNEIIKIDKWFPSSKKCSKCGKKKKHLKLSQRIYTCAFCGNKIDRDLNAAINIKDEGLRLLLEK